MLSWPNNNVCVNAHRKPAKNSKVMEEKVRTNSCDDIWCQENSKKILKNF